MPELEGIGDRRPATTWPLVAIGLGCVALIALLKAQGVILALLVSTVAYFALRFRPDSTEVATLKASVRLSLEDIADVLEAFRTFEVGQDPDSIADRTLYRPALLDLDTNSEEIGRFHFLMGNSKRFLRRAESKLHQNLSVGQLERLLQITDMRAGELQQAWLDAREAAYKLGPK